MQRQKNKNLSLLAWELMAINKIFILSSANHVLNPPLYLSTVVGNNDLVKGLTDRLLYYMLWPLIYYSYTHVIYSFHICARCLYLLLHYLGLISAVNISWSHLSNGTVTHLPCLPHFSAVFNITLSAFS